MIKWFSSTYKTYIFDPLAGGNGKIQMDEYAKAILLAIIGYSAYLEGRGPEQMFPDIYWIMLFGAVCAIAAIKPAFSKKDVIKEIKEDGVQDN